MRSASLASKIYVTLGVFFIVLISIGSCYLIFLENHDNRLRSLVELNSSFLRLEDSLGVYKDYISQNMVGLLEASSKSRHIKAFQENHKRLALNVLKNIRISTQKMDVFIDLFNENSNVEQVKQQLFSTQAVFMKDFEDKERQINRHLLYFGHVDKEFSELKAVKKLDDLSEGLIKLNMELMLLIQDARLTFKAYMATMFTAVIVFIGIVAVFFTIRIRSRLRYLQSISEALKHERGLPKKENSYDEIGLVVQSLYELSEKLIKSSEEVKKNELELQALNDRLVDLNASLVKTIENERLDISQFVHNNLGQTLTAMQLQLEWIREENKENATLCQDIEGFIHLIRASTNDVRKIANSINPPLMDKRGFSGSVRYLLTFFEEYKFNINLKIECDEETLNAEQKISLYRIVQEALVNVARHAKATHVDVVLKDQVGGVELLVQDNGCGLRANSGHSTGLKGIESRVNHLMGRMELKNGLDKGAVLSVKIPLISKSYETV